MISFEEVEIRLTQTSDRGSFFTHWTGVLEIEFINSYYYLMSKRFGDNLKLTITIPENKMYYSVIPFCLQLLVENAIKHNVVSRKKPLSIDIYIENENYLVVENNIQKKHEPPVSTGVGLANIENRYRLLTEKTVSIIKTESTFTVKLPVFQE